MEKQANRKARNRPMTISEYQRRVARTDDHKKLLVSLLGLVGEMGDIQTVFKRRLELGRYPRFQHDMEEELGDTLWYVASLATTIGLSLSDIATKNIAKAEELHLQGDVQKFDNKFPKDERLPRQFDVVFEEKDLDAGVQVKIVVNDVFVGDALTDNAQDDDGYRYHDAFHLAYAACLGWSPVIRGLLRRKRKSVSKTDEVEDGARAIIVEEAISVFLFNLAHTRNFFAEMNAIDISLLKTIRKLCGGLEVRKCTAKQWRNAIFLGYQVFRSLRDNQGGIVSLDLDKASILYTPLRQQKREATRAKRSRKGLSSRVAGRRKTPSSQQGRGI